jgi:hypothetical protein
MILLTIWIILAIVIGNAASARGRDGGGWFVLSIVLSPIIAGLLLLLLPVTDSKVGLKRRGRRACPFCAEPIQRAAKLCPHCQSNVEIPPLTRRQYWTGLAKQGALIVVVLGTIILFGALSRNRDQIPTGTTVQTSETALTTATTSPVQAKTTAKLKDSNANPWRAEVHP